MSNFTFCTQNLVSDFESESESECESECETVERIVSSVLHNCQLGMTTHISLATLLLMCLHSWTLISVSTYEST